jgi:hypothetical protein
VHWEFAIEPRANTHDPLQLFLESPFGSPPRVTEISDTSYRPTMLTPSPTLVRVVLNQWVAFDQPGKYRLRVAHVPYSDQTAGTPAEVSSNPIELEILPSDEAWQNAELQRLLRKLTDAEAAGAVADFAPAASGLRYLGTEEAAREMARRIRNGNLSADGEFADGLITSPNWRAGLQEMRRLVRDPDFPIPHYNFTDTLAILESAARRESSRRPISANELMTDAMAAVIAALPLKAEKAGMVTDDTVRTAISFAGTGARQALTAELLRVFESLSQSRQMGYLNDSAWESVGSAQWARVLGRVAAKYRIPAGQPGNDETVELLLATLRHWYEVDPANARPAILQEMVRPRPLYSAQEIGVLPDRTLPDQEKELLGHLLDSGPLPEDIKANILSLLGRYGTGARLEEVIRREAPPAGTAPCHIQPEFLAHVLKADAKSARPLLERAMACKATGPPQGRNFGIFTELILSQEGEFPARELHLPAAAMVRNEKMLVYECGPAGVEVVPVQDGVEGQEIGALGLPSPEGAEGEHHHVTGAERHIHHQGAVGDGLAAAQGAGEQHVVGVGRETGARHAGAVRRRRRSCRTHHRRRPLRTAPPPRPPRPPRPPPAAGPAAHRRGRAGRCGWARRWA